MTILVVGSGGREHALAWKLAQEAEVIAAPGNPGIAEVARCFPTPALDISALVALARDQAVDLVVVGPEDPLIVGLADALREAGIATFGPGREAAQLEGSKAFSKQLMNEAGVPTAAFGVFDDPRAAMAFCRARDEEGLYVVVKASGAALGKGVTVCGSLAEAQAAVRRAMVDREYGEAGAVVVVEDRLEGRELSLLTLCSDQGIFSLPLAQDYKRAFDNDEGPNTGGMGGYSPIAWAPVDLVQRAEAHVVQPILDALRRRGIAYRGVLFSGLMVDGDDVHCLEYNVRFGDPETQTVMARLGSGLAVVLGACARGEVIPPIEVLENAAVSVVVASEGYPGSIRKGLPVEIGLVPPEVRVFQAGIADVDGRLVTNGGRVATVTATAPTLAAARELAYAGASQVRFEGAWFRTDIAQ
ncbi:MAG: phosphoribosylamine--glycine ligase [Fimbriimonas ginsengisoli]|uniref:Phosphoribosylamine--glycine ligase n=1 Tax=Fimbriimonas ginsengisoli TaxID=1005039 RepID=A0A931PUB1_FIMGI|nr:phosphoribosylamine--glycine ligase [Fimbriimonas ginsengisoli]MBI3721762.1 phosphoribosylamine--glycine ligase [Fimbriimonas ginsengisoli]